MSPLAGYIAAMRELCASAPDRRTGANARLEMADIGMAAFAVFFLQCPSFLAAQAQLQSRQGRSNARTLFGIERLPTDSHIRSVLDGVPPERFDSIFTRTVDRLDRQGALDRLRRLDGRLLIALDGTEYFTSCSIGCRNCPQRKLADGRTQNFHAVPGAGIVAPGTSRLLPLPPEFIRPQDGAEKQDCEINAAKRWLRRTGSGLARLRPVYLGDDLYCRQPFCEAVLAAGGSFILTCKPSSHTTLYEYIQGVETGCLTRTEGRKKNKRRLRCRWMNGLPIRDGKDALEVNWFEVTITSPSGKRLCRNSFATDLPVGPDSVAELADCARARWKVENNTFKALKDGYHLEHNFGHGKETLASLLATFNLIAFLMQSACDLVCESWQEARAKLAARYRLLDNLKFLTAYVVHDDWDAVMRTIITGELPEKPP